MKLTKEQREYIIRRLQQIRSIKKSRITINPPHHWMGNLVQRDDYPDKVNKSIENIIAFYKTEVEKYNAAFKPIDTAHTEALERTIFAENYEQVQQILSSFEAI